MSFHTPRLIPFRKLIPPFTLPTSMYLNSKIFGDKSKLNMAVFSHWQATARLLEVVTKI